MKVNRLSAENTNDPNYENARRAEGGESLAVRRQEKTKWKRGNKAGEWDEETKRAFLHYRHVRGLITGTRGVIFSPSSSRRFAAFFFGPGATPRRFTLLGMRQAVHRRRQRRR